MKECKNPMIVFTKYSPYFVVENPDIENHKGEKIDISKVNAFCRCGESKKKPYCDGSHVKANFVGEKKDGRLKNKLRDYIGEKITIHDNRSFCCHDGSCLRLLPKVFRDNKRVWIDPNADEVEKIIEAIKKCPSGALSYSIGNKKYKDFERKANIRISENGPLEITGFIEIKDDSESEPESKEHYTLCRCGQSKNIPFCDGEHNDFDF